MADPKIRFDVVANAEGGGEIDKLTASLEKLDQAIDPAAAARAQELAAELQRLGEQEAAIARFRDLSSATEKARSDFAAAESAAAALRAEIAAAGEPTTAQAGRMERLSTAVESARVALLAQDIALQASQGRLAALGVDSANAAKAETDLGAATKAVRAELQELGTSLKGVQARQLVDELTQLGNQQQAIATFRDLGLAAEKAQTGLTSAEKSLQDYRAGVADLGPPTEKQVTNLQRLIFAVDDAKAKLAQQAAAAAAAGDKLSALGIETGNLAAAEERLRTAAQGTLTQIEALGRTQAAVQRFQELATATDKASAELGQAVANVIAFRSSMSSATAPTAAEAAELQKLSVAAHAAQAALQESSAAQDRAAEAARAAGASVERLALAQANGREQAATTASAVGQVASAYQRQGATAEASAVTQVASHKAIGESVRTLGDQLRSIQTIAAAALGGQLLGGLAGDLAKTSDEFQNLQSRIKLVTGEGDNFTTAWRGVVEVADRTNASLAATGDLFTRIAQAGKLIGVTNADALRLTETINQAVTISGASAESSNAAITQLIQGLQSGVLRGDEFNSVMEQAPRLAKALADGLGVTTGELRKLAEAGQLTAATVISSLQGQSQALQSEFDKMPLTIGRSIQSLSNAWTIYIGQAGQASGASATVASAIQSVSEHLDTLGTVLLGAGKAALAYKAISLASEFLNLGTAARSATVAIAAKTSAVVADTAATVTNTGAQVANAAAQASAAAGASKFAGLINGIKLFSLVGVLLNVREIGTAIGEAAAKWMGYGKAIENAEINARADEETSKRNAAAKAQLAQQMQIAADRALGLTDESRKLVGVFEQARQKGDEVSVALAALSKELTFGDLSGITNGIAALDALEAKGKITAAQLRDTVGTALNGIDLGVFATNATAAFDSSEQGARRLKLALDAVADESLRRAGTSLDELKTGFSRATSSAINDVDALVKTIQTLGPATEDAQRVISGSLDKALDTANTKRALQEVIDRYVELGKQGLISGDQLAAGLQKAKDKVDALLPGVNSLDEALKNFGLQTQTQLQATADKLAASYQKIANSTTVSLADLRKAFDAYSAAAIAANHGIEPGAVAVARAMLEIKEAAEGAGKGIADGMKTGSTALDAIYAKLKQLGVQLNATAGSLSQLSEARNATVKSILGENTYDKQGFATDSNGQRIVGNSQANVPDGYKFNQQAFQRDSNFAGAHGQKPPDPNNPLYFISTKSYTVPPYVPPKSGGGTSNGSADVSPFGSAGSPSPSPSPSPAPAPKTYYKSYTLGGQTFTASGSTQAAADAAAADAIARYNATQPNAKPGSAPPPIAPPPAAANTVVNVTIGANQYSVGVTSKSAADQMVEALEVAFRAGGN